MRLPDLDALFADTRLGHMERLLFIAIVHYSDERGMSPRAVRAWKAKTHISVGHANTLIHHLSDAGYIRVTSSFIFLSEKGLLPQDAQPRAAPLLELPGPAILEAGNVRITIRVEPRDT